ncbi:MAG TPA: L,D-transpeptidase family protein, partial [Cyclobacteriaceae bacterium]|nr:L,D-transpeptidase family protein [Cyclobacteriaceae bacterium]
MKRCLLNRWMAGGLTGLIFFVSYTYTFAQGKTYQQILYGEAAVKTVAMTDPNTQSTEKDKTDVKEASPKAGKKAEPVAIDTTILTAAENPAVFSDAYVNSRVADKRDNFYKTNDFQTKWLYDSEPAPLYYALIQNLRNADIYGLNPDDFNAEAVDRAVWSLYSGANVTEHDIVAFDVRITELYFLFTTQLSEGKIRNAGYENKLWLREQKPSSDVDAIALAEAKSAKDLDKIFESIQPENDQYHKLQEALAFYRDLARNAVEKLPAVNVTGRIEPLAHHKAIPLIRKRLSQFDLHVYPTRLDSITGQWDTLLYDKGLVQGIIAFQTIHGLEPDGVIGPMTVTYLNKTLQSRVEAVAVNLDRMRWMLPADTEEHYILVNIPDYKLRIYEKNKEVYQMRVIVGAVENPTPVFNDRVEHVVFSPTWTVPVSIIKNEIIPRLKSNPDYYTEKNYVFYKNGEKIDPASEAWGSTGPGNYRIVQQSGGDNSLGRVKFGMNNSMRIYLHDTPSQRLFAKDYRALSHGCIRLDEPAEFAEYLLRNNSGWDTERIRKQMFSGNASTVILRKSYPVHVQYCTAWVDVAGRVNFREDIYG